MGESICYPLPHYYSLWRSNSLHSRSHSSEVRLSCHAIRIEFASFVFFTSCAFLLLVSVLFIRYFPRALTEGSRFGFAMMDGATQDIMDVTILRLVLLLGATAWYQTNPIDRSVERKLVSVIYTFVVVGPSLQKPSRISPLFSLLHQQKLSECSPLFSWAVDKS